MNTSTLRKPLPHRAVAIGLGLLLMTLFSGCEGTRRVEAATDHRALVAQGAPLIDVRTPAEFAAGHVEGAVNIPVDEVGRRLTEVASLAGTDKSVVVYCKSGRRSAAAAETLRAEGYRVIDIGPMSAW